MKQTAVDWLFNKLLLMNPNLLGFGDYLEQAKEMEEGQIALAYSTGTLDGVTQNFTNGYTYYKKTYKKK